MDGCETSRRQEEGDGRKGRGVEMSSEGGELVFCITLRHP